VLIVVCPGGLVVNAAKNEPSTFVDTIQLVAFCHFSNDDEMCATLYPLYFKLDIT
jgi:hypothetical protein